PRISDYRVNIGLVQVEIPTRDVEDVRVDLDSGDLHARAERSGVLSSRGAARQAEDRDVPGGDLGTLGRTKRIRDHHVVPRASCLQALGVVDGVDGLSLIQDQLGLRSVLHYLDVVIRGLLLVQKLTDLGWLVP